MKINPKNVQSLYDKQKNENNRFDYNLKNPQLKDKM